MKITYKELYNAMDLNSKYKALKYDSVSGAYQYNVVYEYERADQLLTDQYNNSGKLNIDEINAMRDSEIDIEWNNLQSHYESIENNFYKEQSILYMTLQLEILDDINKNISSTTLLNILDELGFTNPTDIMEQALMKENLEKLEYLDKFRVESNNISAVLTERYNKLLIEMYDEKAEIDEAIIKYEQIMDAQNKANESIENGLSILKKIIK